jgi:hypothetical protein
MVAATDEFPPVGIEHRVGELISHRDGPTLPAPWTRH